MTWKHFLNYWPFVQGIHRHKYMYSEIIPVAGDGLSLLYIPASVGRVMGTIHRGLEAGGLAQYMP